MRRFSNESGLDAKDRNVGRLALAVIPAALGGAALLWVAATMDWVTLTKHERAEQRLLENVGLKEVPKSPIRFEGHDDRCFKIESARMRDGDHFVFYARNLCQHKLVLPLFSYRLMAQDGTVLESQRYRFDGDDSLMPSERREQIIWIEHGTERIDVVRIDAQDNR